MNEMENEASCSTSGIRKRKSIIEDNVEVETKKIKSTYSHNLLEFSDCVLLHILKYLSATDLFQLSRSSTRFERVINDIHLWVNVDARHSPNCRDKTLLCIENVGKQTKKLLFAGDKRSDVVLPKAYLKTFAKTRLNNLTILALEHQYIDGKDCSISQFPHNLRELSLRCSYVNGETAFFRQSSETMSHLRVLILDQCRWVTVESLLPISKYPKLQILSLFLCMRMNDSLVSYLSLTGRFGFPNLQIVDLRFTCLGEQFVNSFYKSGTLQHIYFQNYNRTYRSDRSKRLDDITNGRSQMLEHAYFVPTEVDDTDVEQMQAFYGESIICQTRVHRINNQTFRYMQQMTSMNTPSILPSTLYTLPYSTCTCGFIPGDITSMKVGVVKKSEPTAMVLCLLQTTCPNSDKYDSCTLQNGVTQGEGEAWIFNREPRNDLEIDKFEHSVLYEPMSVWYARSHNHNSTSSYKTKANTYPKHRLVITIEPNGEASSMRHKLPQRIHRVIDESEMEEFIEVLVEGLGDEKQANDELIEDILERLDSIMDLKIERCPIFFQRMRTTLNELKRLHPHEHIRDLLLRHRLCFHDLMHEPFDAEGSHAHILDFFTNIKRYEERFWSCQFTPHEGDDEPIQTETPEVDVRNSDFHRDAMETPLKQLSLRGYPYISDLVLHNFSNVQLDLLDVTQTEVTEEGVRNFMRTNPGCRIVHECACVCKPRFYF